MVYKLVEIMREACNYETARVNRICNDNRRRAGLQTLWTIEMANLARDAPLVIVERFTY
jgi:hypothetical protein